MAVWQRALESVEMIFWRGKRVFITGHTGFKGAWLSLWLSSIGAKVTGYSLEPPTKPSMFELCRINSVLKSITADIRDGEKLKKAVKAASPEIVFHLAAQPIVRQSYENPVETYSTNVMGTVNLLEAVRMCGGIKAVVNITSDKCYENKEWVWGYRESDPMGGYDPYSSSKGCAELVTAAYRSSFFQPSASPVSHASKHPSVQTSIATVRAGNVIGGGDWAKDRLVPDCIRALIKREKILIRNPHAVRPWQHVLEPLSGYLVLAQRLYEDGIKYAEAWNFGPDDADAKSVEWIVKMMCDKWGSSRGFRVERGKNPHEAHYLKLDCSKAKAELGWQPEWGLEKAIDMIIEWTKTYVSGGDMRAVSLKQIQEYRKV